MHASPEVSRVFTRIKRARSSKIRTAGSRTSVDSPNTRVIGIN